MRWAGTLVVLLAASPLAAQMHDMPGMAGMDMPHHAVAPVVKKKAAPKADRPTRKTPIGSSSVERSRDATVGNPSRLRASTGSTLRSQRTEGVTPSQPAIADMPDMTGMAGHDMVMPMSAPPPAGAVGTDQAVAAQASPAPAPPTDHAADAVYGGDAMAAARAALHREHGGMTMHRVLINLAEAQVRSGRDGVRWDAEGWIGGDIDRLVVKSEGSGEIGRAVDEGEVQALYSHAVGPYSDVQGGVRQDIGRGPKRTYATAGIEGLAPYGFEVEGAVFVSDHGDVLARAEGWADQRLTQRLILQPRVELNFAAQDVPSQRIGAGLSDAELGLRLRYEVRRTLAPYVGVSWTRRTASRAAPAASETAAVFGIRAWF